MALLGKNNIEEAFEKLYFENYSYLCRSIYRFVRDEEITKDMVQDVFLKYWQKIGELRITESPKAYLQRACINQALNYLKEKERRTERELFYANEDSASAGNSDRPDAIYISSETSTNLNLAIDRLPPACRKAFLLSRHEQKNYKEIAKLLDISVNTVEKHIGKALKVLRGLIKPI